MSKTNIKKKAVSGMVWTTINKFTKMGLQFVSGIILARLLTPHDYGCIGMIMIFMALADAFIDGGFGDALIQKKKTTQKDYSTIFYWNIGLSILMYFTLFISAPTIADFYNLPLLCDVLRVQGIVLFFYALMIIQKTQLRKKLNFKVIAVIRIISAIISILITIIMAYKGFGVWALVVQNILGTLLPTVAYCAYVKWYPSWTFSWKSFKELFSFGFYMFLTNIINSFTREIQSLFIGRLYSSITLGYYSKALRVESTFSQTVSNVMTQVSYPLYSELQDDKKMLGEMIKRLASVISYVTIPFLLFAMLEAKTIFVFLYSDRWLSSVPYFQILCIAGILASIQSVNLQAIAAIGKSKQMFYWTLIKRGIGIFVIILGLLLWGMNGILAGVVFFNFFALCVNIGLVSKYIGYRWTKQINDILPIALVSMIAFIICYLLGSILSGTIYVVCAFRFLVFMSIYLSWSLIWKPQSYMYTKTALSLLIYKIGKKH